MCSVLVDMCLVLMPYEGRFPCSPGQNIAESRPKRFYLSASALATPSVESITLLRRLSGDQWVLARPFQARYGLGVKPVCGMFLDSAVDTIPAGALSFNQRSEE